VALANPGTQLSGEWWVTDEDGTIIQSFPYSCKLLNPGNQAFTEAQSVVLDAMDKAKQFNLQYEAHKRQEGKETEDKLRRIVEQVDEVCEFPEAREG